jgi:tetratricopeptide (TPR) repeat protein
MIRTGLDQAGNAADWREVIDSHFRVLRQADYPFAFTEKLRLHTLESEFHALLGDIPGAATILSAVVSPPDADNPTWFRNLPDPPASQSEDDLRKQRRQMVWARMYYIWIHLFYAGRFDEAIRQLDALRPIIDRELPVNWNGEPVPSHGTMGRWHYFYAHCLRGNRRFVEAEEEFLAAQESAAKRLEFRMRTARSDARAGKLTEHEARSIVNYEMRFSSICTARILSALGWVAMQQGLLVRAQQCFASARALIEGTGQEAMKSAIRLRHAIASRRIAPLDRDDFKTAMSELRKSAEDYRLMGDVGGQLRCELEIGRGHVDAAGFSDSPTARRHHLAEALKSLKIQDELLAAGGGGGADVRRHLLWTKFYLVQAKVASHSRTESLGQARKSFLAARLASGTQHSRFGRTDLDLFEGLLLLREGEYPDAAELLSTVLQNSQHDPVVQAECRLLLAECYIKWQVNRERAEEHLNAWKQISATVQNQYLHCAYDDLTARFDVWGENFVIESTRDDLNWEVHERALKIWLMKTARAKLKTPPTLDKLSEILGPSPSTLSRWPKV